MPKLLKSLPLAGWTLLLLGIAAPAPAADYHDNVVIVLDASGSMRSPLRGTTITKIDAAKAALKEVLKSVPASTHVGLLVFSAKNLKNDWAYPLGPRDDDALMRAIDLPQPDSGTPLGKYIKKGADRLLEERRAQFGYGTYRLLVVTDGEAQDNNLVNQFTPEIMARGITMDVIGVDMRTRHTLATKVHSYRAANDPKSLQRAIQEVFAEVSNRQSDTASEDIFDLIAPIPVETAAAVIQTLATSGNEPIGEKPRARTPARTSPAPQGAPSRTQTTHSVSVTQSKPSGVWRLLKTLFFIAVAGVVFMLALLIFVINLVNRRRRR